jgi:hypothetical protein
MSIPSSRQGLIDYCLRKLGYPVLEINVDDDQISDLVDDAIQYFQERHYDGVERTFLKYKVTKEDIDRGKAKIQDSPGVGIVSTSKTTQINGTNTTFSYYENSNYISIPDHVIGVNNIFKFSTSTISGSMFSIKYQLFLNDLYQFNSIELLQYSMVKRYLEDIDFLLTPEKQIRFNKKQGKLYLDMDWAAQIEDTFLVIDCIRALDPTDFNKIYNDWWLKRYLTSLIKKQWGQNMIKFNGVQLPGGITLNGRQLYDDAVAELEKLEEQLHTEYELPPMDMIG